MTPLAEKIREYRSPEFEWTDSTIRMQLQMNLGNSATDVDAAFAEVDTPKTNGHSKPQEIMKFAAIEEQQAVAASSVAEQYKIYLLSLFKPEDTICFVTIEHNKDRSKEKVINKFVRLDDAATTEFFQSLETVNDTPSTIEGNSKPSVYVAVNSYPAHLIGSRVGRTQENVVEIRGLYTDVDENGQATLDKIGMSQSVPEPPIVFESSPGRFQGIWPVDGISKEEAKPLLKALAQDFDTDVAVAETARVLRVPGLKNHKYPDAPEVKVVRLQAKRYQRTDFKLQVRQEFEKTAPVSAAGEKVLFKHGEIHPALGTQTSKMMNAGVFGQPLIDAILVWANDNCEKPLDEAKIIKETKDREKRYGDEIKNRPSGDIIFKEPPVSQRIVVPEVEVERYAISQEERERRLDEDEYPVIPLVEQAGPTWEDDMMYGVCGDIIRKASQYCEAHPAGMYLDLVGSLGSVIGRKPYFNINQTRHYTNEFIARVGLTAESRKGTGRDVIDELLQLVDPSWYHDRVTSGFGSAEAIINELRDPMPQQVRDKKSSDGFKTITVPGVTDKRLCIREGELASVFQLAGKTESRADIVLREGWDGKPLRNKVKGKSHDGLSNSAVCMEPHLSISGDTTRSELMDKMPAGAADNGFGNRFLYCFVYRIKLCPHGGPQLAWGPEIIRLYDAIQWARTLTYIPLTKAAAKVWGRMYMELDDPKNKLPGLAGAMTARAAAHIRRLALIYALLDEHDVVDTKHLHAAKRMWDYCQESARYIFTGMTGDQDRIRRYVEANGPTTLAQIRRDLFHDHKSAEWLKTQVDALVRNTSSSVIWDGDKVTIDMK